MPTYEYLCDKCGHTFEVFQPMTAEALTVCPKERCAKKRWGQGKIRRTIGGGAGLIFKGSGFYITDYRSDSYKAAAKQDSPTPAPSTSASPGKTQPSATPAAKSASKPSGSAPSPS